MSHNKFTHREKVHRSFLFYFSLKVFFWNTLPGPMFFFFIFLWKQNFVTKMSLLFNLSYTFQLFPSFIVQMSINIGGHNYTSTVFIPLIISSSSFYFFESWIYILSIWPILCELIIVKKWKIWSKAFLISPNSIN